MLHQARHLFALDIEFDPETSARTIAVASLEFVKPSFLSWLLPGLSRKGPV